MHLICKTKVGSGGKPSDPGILMFLFVKKCLDSTEPVGINNSGLETEQPTNMKQVTL